VSDGDQADGAARRTGVSGGAGATGIAFGDVLLSETDATVTSFEAAAPARADLERRLAGDDVWGHRLKTNIGR
jgi:hypothetical protein